MSTLTEASPDSSLPNVFEPRQVAFDKTAWQREYMRRRMQDPEYREKFNEYQRAYHKAKRASDPEYRERRRVAKQKYRSKLQAQLAPLRALDAPPSN